MKNSLPGLPAFAALAPCLLASPLLAAPFDAWQSRHPIPVAAAGFVEIEVPPEALDLAGDGAADLRLADPAGNEVPYLRVASEGGKFAAAAELAPALAPGKTVLTLRVPGQRPVDGVRLQCPTARFLKAVKVEASEDGQTWTPLAEGAPVFRVPNGAEQLQVSFAPTAARRLRLTIDDSRSPAVPFSAAQIHLAADAALTRAAVATEIVERFESPGQTRLEVDLGAAHLGLDAIGLEAVDPLFMRKVRVLVPTFEGAEIREQPLAEGTVYRVAIDGAEPRSQLDFPVDVEVPVRRVALVIENGDSPPLEIGGVRASRRVVRLRFLAGAAGAYTLYTGNSHAGAPSYDVAALARGLEGAAVTRVAVGPGTENPGYEAAAQLPQIPLLGAALDVAGWGYRKPVALAAPGIQQLELDPEVLARTGVEGSDWRLVRGGKQVPYIVHRSALSRSLTPEVSAADDPDRPSVSRWEVALPHERLPVTTLLCRSDTPLFDRAVTLVEEGRDSYGQRFTRTLGNGRWVREAAAPPDAELRLAIDQRPTTDRLLLEIENGDNAPIALRDFALYHPAVRLVFKTAAAAATGEAAGEGRGGVLYLYYGNRKSAAPRYDLGLAAPQLLRAAREVAILGAEEKLEGAAAGPHPIGGRPVAIFWIVIGLVVVALLVFIAKLLPAASSPAGDGDADAG